MSLNLNDCLYQVLGVTEKASLSEIKGAYRRLAQQYHPDKNKHSDTTRFLKISEAYKILSSPDKRRTYDLSRVKMENAGPQQKAAPSQEPPKTYHSFGAIIPENVFVGVAITVKDLFSTSSKDFEFHCIRQVRKYHAGSLQIWQKYRFSLPLYVDPSKYFLFIKDHFGSIFIQWKVFPSYGWHWLNVDRCFQKKITITSRELKRGGAEFRAPNGVWMVLNMTKWQKGQPCVYVINMKSLPYSDQFKFKIRFRVWRRFSFLLDFYRALCRIPRNVFRLWSKNV